MVDTSKFTSTIAEKINAFVKTLPTTITKDYLDKVLKDLDYSLCSVIGKADFYVNQDGVCIQPRSRNIRWKAHVHQHNVYLHPSFVYSYFISFKGESELWGPDERLEFRRDLLKAFGYTVECVNLLEPVIELPIPCWIEYYEDDDSNIVPSYYLKSEAEVLLNAYVRESRLEIEKATEVWTQVQKARFE